MLLLVQFFFRSKRKEGENEEPLCSMLHAGYPDWRCWCGVQAQSDGNGNQIVREAYPTTVESFSITRMGVQNVSISKLFSAIIVIKNEISARELTYTSVPPGLGEQFEVGWFAMVL